MKTIIMQSCVSRGRERVWLVILILLHSAAIVVQLILCNISCFHQLTECQVSLESEKMKMATIKQDHSKQRKLNQKQIHGLREKLASYEVCNVYIFMDAQMKIGHSITVITYKWQSEVPRLISWYITVILTNTSRSEHSYYQKKIEIG